MRWSTILMTALGLFGGATKALLGEGRSNNDAWSVKNGDNDISKLLKPDNINSKNFYFKPILDQVLSSSPDSSTSNENNENVLTQSYAPSVVIDAADAEDLTPKLFGVTTDVEVSKCGEVIEVSNENTTEPYDSRIAHAGDKFVIVYNYAVGRGGIGDNFYGIAAQAFYDNGTKISKPFRVNQYTSATQWDPGIAALSNGDFVGVWTGGCADFTLGICGQVFHPNGTLIGAEFIANTFELPQYSPAFPVAPVVTGLLNNGFAVAEQSYFQDNSSYSIWAQAFSPKAALLKDSSVNNYTSGDQKHPAITTLSSGDYIITWYGNGANGAAIYARLFNGSNYTPISNDILVSKYTNGSQINPSIASYLNGGSIVTWEGEGKDDLYGVYIQRLDNNGVKIGNAGLVNTQIAGKQDQPSVATLENGMSVVVWRGNGTQIFAQIIDSEGNKIGNELQISMDTANNNTQPCVAALSDNKFAITWSVINNGTYLKVVAQIYNYTYTETTKNNNAPLPAALWAGIVGGIAAICAGIGGALGYKAYKNKKEKYKANKANLADIDLESNKPQPGQIKFESELIPVETAPKQPKPVPVAVPKVIVPQQGKPNKDKLKLPEKQEKKPDAKLKKQPLVKKKSLGIELGNENDMTKPKAPPMALPDADKNIVPFSQLSSTIGFFHRNSNIVDNYSISYQDIIPYNPNNPKNPDCYLLGEGGFGYVYASKYQGAKVAVKEFHPDFVNKDSFRNEVLEMMAVNHPNIIKLFGYTSQPYSIVMELMDGSLFDMLHPKQGKTTLSFLSRLQIAKDIAAALQHLHNHKPTKIIHRDLKSLNVLLTKTGDKYTAKLTDFGLAKTLKTPEASATMTLTENGPVGTVQWMAPELLDPCKPHPEYSIYSDIYAFGMILWELATGERPCMDIYDQNNPNAIPSQVLKGYRPKIPPECDPFLAQLIQDCLQPDPKNRPSAEALTNSLELKIATLEQSSSQHSFAMK